VATPATLAEEHQAGQEALVALLPAIVRQAWPLLDVHDLRGTLPRFIAAITAIVRRYGSASSAASLTYYRQARAASPMPGTVSLRMAPPPPEDAIRSAVLGSVADLYGPVTPELEQAVQDKVAEATAQLVLDQGRQTLIEATQHDKAAKGWVRVTETGACAFCLMLALRGAAYRSKKSGDFKAHDNCRCHVEPIFTAYEPSARMREAAATYKKAKDAPMPTRIAFRRLVEGRPLNKSVPPGAGK
jgi:hypothetical protein